MKDKTAGYSRIYKSDAATEAGRRYTDVMLIAKAGKVERCFNGKNKSCLYKSDKKSKRGGTAHRKGKVESALNQNFILRYASKFG